jgi:hypothetical protein
MSSAGVPHDVSTRLATPVVLLGIGSLVAVVLFTRQSATDVGDSMTRNTVRVSLAWYVVALCLMMRLKGRDWSAATPIGQLTRWCWTWALICFLVHVLAAFHYFHHWSHVHAFEHTRQVAGIGEGLYFSYLFTGLWIADVVAWWLWPARYAARPAWIDRALHCLMIFIVFNSMVVFESGLIRWAGVAMIAVLGCAWFMSYFQKSKTNDLGTGAQVDSAST